MRNLIPIHTLFHLHFYSAGLCDPDTEYAETIEVDGDIFRRFLKKHLSRNHFNETPPYTAVFLVDFRSNWRKPAE